MSRRDPGLQAERTAMAWQRTGVSAAVVAVLLLRTGIAHTAPLEIASGALLTAVSVLAVVASRARARTRRFLLTTTTAVVAAGAVTTVQVLFR